MSIKQLLDPIINPSTLTIDQLYPFIFETQDDGLR